VNRIVKELVKGTASTITEIHEGAVSEMEKLLAMWMEAHTETCLTLD
jgi:hypothetical protein